MWSPTHRGKRVVVVLIARAVHSELIGIHTCRCSVMAQGPTFFILKSLLPLPASEADLLLGRIVKNFEAPWTVSAPKDVSKLTEGFPEGGNKDFKLEKQTSKNVSLKMRLQGLLGINLIGSLDSRLDLEGKKLCSNQSVSPTLSSIS